MGGIEKFWQKIECGTSVRAGKSEFRKKIEGKNGQSPFTFFSENSYSELQYNRLSHEIFLRKKIIQKNYELRHENFELQFENLGLAANQQVRSSGL